MRPVQGVFVGRWLVLLAAGLGVVAGAAAPAGAREAPVTAVPRAACQPGDKPDTGLQGQIPLADRLSGRAREGYRCNLRLVGSLASRTFASFDAYEHCAYLPDETWVSGATQTLHTGRGIGGAGIRVVDMSDPENPKQTALLTSPIALAPDEAMAVNARRGLLVMNSTADSEIDVYDLKPDCTRPKLIGTFDMAPAMGHAGWFSPDGTVYWMTSLVNPTSRNLFPIDLTDPRNPKLMAEWETSPLTGGHNGWVSDDGRTTYACQISLADRTQNRVLVFDSPVPGARVGSSEEHLVGSFPVEGAVCQDMKAVSYDGRPFLIANSEYTIGRGLQKGPSLCGAFPENRSNFAAPQIFDVSDPKRPKLAADLALEVDVPANCRQTMFDGDATAGSGIPGEVYDTHFCRPDRLHDPTILACSRFLSGLEVYDIRDPYHPKELAYYRTGTLGDQALEHPEWGALPTTIDDSFAPPVVRAENGEIWFTNYFTGLKVVRLPKSVYPFRDSLTCENDWYFDQYNPGLCPEGPPSPRSCVDRRAVTIEVRGLGDRRVRSLTASVNGKRQRVQRGRRRSIRVRFAGLAGRRVTVRVVARLADGGRMVDRRAYRLCAVSERDRSSARGAALPRTAMRAQAAAAAPPAVPAAATQPPAAAVVRWPTLSASPELRMLCFLLASQAGRAVTSTGAPAR